MSEKSAEIVPGLVAGGGRIRTKYSADAKRALVQLCTRPGVSVARMALSHGINANLLRKWIKQFADGQAPVRASKPAKATAPVLLPVVSVAPEAPRAPTSAAESCIEIAWAAATVRIRGAVDARALAVVLDCLAQRA